MNVNVLDPSQDERPGYLPTGRSIERYLLAVERLHTVSVVRMRPLFPSSWLSLMYLILGIGDPLTYGDTINSIGQKFVFAVLVVQQSGEKNVVVKTRSWGRSERSRSCRVSMFLIRAFHLL